ncbi:MAG: BON domain-containing protein [Shewanella oncorhynchi]
MKIIILATAVILSLSACDAPQTTRIPTETSSNAEASPADTKLTIEIKRALASDNELKSIDIVVATIKGDVRLTGVTENQAQIERAVEITENIDGVNTLHHELTIKK